MPLGGAVRRLSAGAVEALLLIIAAQAILLIDPHAVRWADFVKTAHLRALVPLLALSWAVYLFASPRLPLSASPLLRVSVSPRPRVAASPRLPFSASPRLSLAAVVATTALSTLVSVAPGVSLWGDQRLTTGLLTVLSWAVVFGAAATVLRTWAQVERLMRTLLLATLSAALLGAIEGAGLSPLTSLLIVGQRAGSTMGNAIFFGSLLVLVLPIALAWLWTAARPQPGAPPDTSPAQAAPRRDRSPRRVFDKRGTRGRGETGTTGVGAVAWIALLLGQQALFVAWLLLASGRPDAPWAGPAILVAFVWLGARLPPARLAAPSLGSGRRLAVVGLAMLSVMLLAALLLTRARGPWLAAGVAVAVLAVWLAWPRWRRWAVVALPALGALLAVLSIYLSIYGGPEIGRLTATVAGRSAGVGDLAVQSRVLTWQTVAALVAAPPDLAGGDLGARPVRLLVGYGPDTLRLLAEQTYPAALRAIEQEAQITSAHNDLLDHLAAVGLLGSAAWLALLASVAWAAVQAYRRADGRQRILLGGVLAGLAGYVVEQMVAPAYPPVRTLAWLLAGALVGLAQGETRGRGDAGTEGRGDAVHLVLAVGYGVATLAIVLALPAASPPGELLRTAGGWWLWSLAGAVALSTTLAGRAAWPLARPRVLAGVLLALAATAFAGSQALRPLVAERLGSAATGAASVREHVPAVLLAAQARSTWPLDERYDFLLGTALVQLAGAQPGGRLPQRLPQPTPPPEPFEPQHLARAAPEQMLDWGLWLVDRAAQRQPLDFAYPLARAQTYRLLAELLGSDEARAEARRALAVAQRLSPTHPRVLELARQLGAP
ncbi:MAG: O-antigen ligase family protein [Chloroflexi bacterium]|nr:O-antigen ligase family protein [Chloroflexota bacterium]